MTLPPTFRAPLPAARSPVTSEPPLNERETPNVTHGAHVRRKDIANESNIIEKESTTFTTLLDVKIQARFSFTSETSARRRDVTTSRYMASAPARTTGNILPQQMRRLEEKNDFAGNA
jgi:hypothetical protein